MDINLTITSKEVKNYLDDKSDMEAEINRLLEIGVAVVERVQASQDVDFVKKEIESMINTFDKRLSDQFSSTERAFEKFLSTYLDPDVEASYLQKMKNWFKDQLKIVKETADVMITNAKDVSTDKMVAIEKGINYANEKFNPDLETSYLGKLKAQVIETAVKINSDLDFNNLESFAYKLQQELKQHFGNDSPILLAIQSIIKLQQTEILEELIKLREEISQKAGVDATMKKTAIKGFVFEDETENMLNALASPYGDIVSRTSLDSNSGRNKKGDFIYEFESSDRIVIECKDEAVGLKPILKYLDEAMQNRDCGFGLLLTKYEEQLPNAAGSFNIYTGNTLLTSYEYLDIALRWYRMYFQYMGKPKEAGTVNKAEIEATIELINSELKNFTNIKTKLTGVTKFVKEENEKISFVTENIRATIITHLNKITAEIN